MLILPSRLSDLSNETFPTPDIPNVAFELILVVALAAIVPPPTLTTVPTVPLPIFIVPPVILSYTLSRPNDVPVIVVTPPV